MLYYYYYFILFFFFTGSRAYNPIYGKFTPAAVHKMLKYSDKLGNKHHTYLNVDLSLCLLCNLSGISGYLRRFKQVFGLALSPPLPRPPLPLSSPAGNSLLSRPPNRLSFFGKLHFKQNGHMIKTVKITEVYFHIHGYI